MDWFWTVIYVYGACGGVVALAFALVGIDRVDEAAHGAWLVRLVLLPGLILLWPVVLGRWIALERKKAATK
jgi:hypothetical protein